MLFLKNKQSSPIPHYAPRAMSENFSPELLRLYYARLFPYDEMFQWLSYGQTLTAKNKDVHSEVDKDFFLRREFSFTIANDVYIRYLSFQDQKDMMKYFKERQPHKVDIGAVYSAPAKDHNTLPAGKFVPLERELVFDIDLTDYDEVIACTSKWRI